MGAEQSHLDQLKDSPNFRQDYVTFFVNGQEHSVKTDGCDAEIGASYRLVDYLRDKAGLTGTKYMCREGGCGSCMVAIRSNHPGTGRPVLRSVNSCLLPLFACDGLEITTVEQLGTRRTGYHAIQERLAQMGGTQCGFCTPGFVMTMYSLMENNPKFTGNDVEDALDGNICRCTGYRPILDAFKSLSPSASEELKRKCQDIEDCFKKCSVKCTERQESFDDSNLQIIQTPRTLHLRSMVGEQWFKVNSLSTLYEVLHQFTRSQMRYYLVAGNTGTGLYPNDGPFQGFIEINDIPELHFVSKEAKEMVLGGAVTLTAAIEQFRQAADTQGYVWASEFHRHFQRAATTSLRNQGTLAGNLMIKHNHREFISDVFTLFESIGATVKVGSSPTLWRQYTLLEFLQLDMYGKVIISIHLPTYSGTYSYRTFKIGKRYQNTIAYVNAAFLFHVDQQNFMVMGRPSIVMGGINPTFIHARATEDFLAGKTISVSTLQSALSILKSEAVPDVSLVGGTQAYRLALAQSYFYKFILGIRGSLVDARLRSGAEDVQRALNTGRQTFESDETRWPLYQPVPKLESHQQASGEAEYVNDIRAELGELFGVFVVTTVANATLKSVDATEALLMPGVVAFITAKDIPGANNYLAFSISPEEVIQHALSLGYYQNRVLYAGQPVGLLVARNKYAAFEARGLVKVTYENMNRVVTSIRQTASLNDKVTYCGDTKQAESHLGIPCRGFAHETAKKVVEALKEKRELKETDDNNNDAVRDDSLIKVKGELYTDRQYHFHMETQICVCVPKENGMNVYSATQHMSGVHGTIAACLSIPANQINVEVRRLGGGFGAKTTKVCQVACACAVAAHVLNQPVRVAVDLSTNMRMIGKRLAYHVTYDVDVDSSGKIHSLAGEIVCDTGSVVNEPTSLYAMICAQSCYQANNWNLAPGYVQTDTAPNTYCRAPGSAQGVGAIETIMEHIAYTVKKDPLEVRQVNFMKKGDPLIGVPGAKLPTENFIPKMLKEILESSDFQRRKQFVETFNRDNRFKKRGISIVPQRFPNQYPLYHFPVLVSVYAIDGTVNVTHGGIEMGQGINTKVAQVVASTLGVSLDMVKIQPSSTVSSPNTSITAGSIGSELTCYSARRACEILLERLAPIRAALPAGTPWLAIVQVAHFQEILLAAQFQGRQGDLVSYDIWGITATEVEIDVLTGDYKIIRADILNDTGFSLSPLVDIGQIEGAFIMGLGWWLTEELIYDPSSGALLTDNTHSYKPMMASDIPEDLRVTLLRNTPNQYGFLSSKATGEPPLNLSCSVIFALRNAIDSARRDVGNNEWYQMDGPVTRETILRLCLTSPEQFTF